MTKYGTIFLLLIHPSNIKKAERNLINLRSITPGMETGIKLMGDQIESMI